MNKSVQDADISVKILKENAEYICFQFNEAICTSKFPTSSKFAHVTPIFKQRSRNQKDIGQSASYLLSQKYLKSLKLL